MDQCILNIRRLDNTFEIVEELIKLTKETISLLKETETRLNQLECKIDQTEFLSDYRDWVRIFINDLAGKLGEKEWYEADKAFGYIKRGMTLTSGERNSIEKLKVFLRDIEVLTDDIKLLHELRDKSNASFHNNGQTLTEAKARLDGPIPDDMKIYKVPLQKALKAISTWRN